MVLNQKIEMCIGAALNVVWSPDSNYLAYTETIQEQSYVLAINIYTGEVIDISKIQDFAPHRWFNDMDWLNMP